MTLNEAQTLKRRKSFIFFAGARYRFLRLEKITSRWFIIIEDEPGHEDKLLMSNCALISEGVK